jgi:hypothetical protein
MPAANRVLIVRDDMEVAPKGATEVFPLTFDWSRQLPGQTLLSSTWESLDGLPIVDAGFTDERTSVEISGGSEGVYYELRNTVTTDDGTFTASTFVAVNRP